MLGRTPTRAHRGCLGAPTLSRTNEGPVSESSCVPRIPWWMGSDEMYQPAPIAALGLEAAETTVSANDRSTKLEALYAAYRTPVYRYLRSRTASDDEAADLTATTFEHALVAIDGSARTAGRWRGCSGSPGMPRSTPPVVGGPPRGSMTSKSATSLSARRRRSRHTSKWSAVRNCGGWSAPCRCTARRRRSALCGGVERQGDRPGDRQVRGGQPEGDPTSARCA